MIGRIGITAAKGLMAASRALKGAASNTAKKTGKILTGAQIGSIGIDSINQTKPSESYLNRSRLFGKSKYFG